MRSRRLISGPYFAARHPTALLNPVENVWQYLRQNWLSNTVFENYDAIVDAVCEAWRKLIADPERITSIHRNARLGPRRSAAMTLGIRWSVISSRYCSFDLYNRGRRAPAIFLRR
jgi:hypothetical protein